MLYALLHIIVASQSWGWPVPASGFFSIRDAQAQVVCLWETGLDCAAVEYAIAEINTSVTQPPLYYVGAVTNEEALGITGCEDIVVVAASSLGGSHLGMTHLGRCDAHGLHHVRIEIDAILADSFKITQTSILLHELMHALGVDHAIAGGYIETIMLPHYENNRGHLTAADIATLRAGYERATFCADY